MIASYCQLLSGKLHYNMKYPTTSERYAHPSESEVYMRECADQEIRELENVHLA